MRRNILRNPETVLRASHDLALPTILRCMQIDLPGCARVLASISPLGTTDCDQLSTWHAHVTSHVRWDLLASQTLFHCILLHHVDQESSNCIFGLPDATILFVERPPVGQGLARHSMRRKNPNLIFEVPANCPSLPSPL